MRAAVDHLHAEAKVVSVLDSFGLFWAQYLTNVWRPNHPIYHKVNRPGGEKHILQSIFRLTTNNLLVDGNTTPTDYDHIQSMIHTEAVTKRSQNHSPNIILRKVTLSVIKSKPNQTEFISIPQR